MKLKKTVLTSFTILCLLLTLTLGYKTSVKASPHTIYVPTDYPTIQEAINHASEDDTIFVHNRTYYEHIVVNKSVSLVGEDRLSTIIDGGGTGSVIHVAANNVNISSFTIQKSGIGLYDSGIFLDRCGGNKISHNTIRNSSNGICLSYSVRNTVVNNAASDNKYGISLYSSNDNEIYGNNASDNKYGIALFSSNHNEISNNNASSNKINGIHLHSSSDNIISSNTASLNSYDGIHLDFSTNNMVSDNIISDNDFGIRLQSSSDNLVAGNTASNNYYGIYLHSSSNNNTIYHNNFNNTDQIWSDSINAWDNGYEGNYWSDYTEQDLNRDGIGDTPYFIDTNNQDNHPLMGMLYDFKVVWDGKIFHAIVICNSTISNFRFEIEKETGNRIVSFNVTGEDDTVGFCRIAIPTELMNYSLIVLVDGKEIVATLLDASNKTYTHLYFTYVHSSHTITIISSKLLYLYNELLDKYGKLQTNLHNLNSTYHEILDTYDALLERHGRLNVSYQQHLVDYSQLQGDYASILEYAQNVRSLVYVLMATTTIFIIAAVYLSTHAHRRFSGS